MFAPRLSMELICQKQIGTLGIDKTEKFNLWAQKYNNSFIDSDEKDPDLRALLLFAEQGALLIPIIDKDKKIIKVLSVRKIISDKYGS